MHTTLWVAEQPRIDVRAMFLRPLLMETRSTRSVALVMDLVGPGSAIRKVGATEADMTCASGGCARCQCPAA